MKSFTFFSSARSVLQSKEARILGVLLLREALMLSLFSLAIFLSLESILPGTVSLRTGVLFLIVGIALALFFERSLLKTVSLPVETASASIKNKPVFFGLFFFWVAFLLGNSLFGFHVGIIAILLFVTLPLLWVFFTLREETH